MQGRFKRDGSAAEDREPHGGSDRGSSPQRAQGTGATPDATSSTSPARTQAPGGSGESAARPRPTSAPDPGSYLALRNWRISSRLVSLLALPVVAATTLGALRIDTSIDNLQQLENMKLLTEMTKQATELASALQEERDQSAGPLTNGDTKNDDVVYSRLKTDRAKQAFREATEDIETAKSDELVGVNSSLLNILKQLEQIKSIRAGAYTNSDYVALTAFQYNGLISSLLALSQDIALATSNSELIGNTRALAAFSSAKEYASIQRAVISAGLAHKPKPKLAFSDRLYGQWAQQMEDSALAQFTQVYEGKSNPEELQQALSESGNSEIIQADTYAARVLKTEGQISDESERRSYKDWYDQDSTKIEEMAHIEQALLSEMEEKARELRSEAQQEAILNGGIILLVLGVSLVGAFVMARSMIRSLRRLQETAQEVAQKRLPELVKHLSEADPQDVDTSVESVGVHSRDEIGQVAAAFDDVHREAVRLAAEQALLRGNVNAMFTNLSRRSQGLIQRQLTLISELESREADPDQLSSLFKLDHLATRMRRNGENLLVLAGEEPGRRWTRPVPLVDVLRAAASEVEQYERIELSSVPATEVAGRVVNDLVHLLAELLENATSFSSPQTKVKVTGHALPDGRVLVEIHDTGIGLSPEDLAAINERLASPPTVDVSVSRRMGLFVVGRLSLRHGIRIQLRPSDSGGTTALVMLPVDVAQGGAKGPAKPGTSPGYPRATAGGTPTGSGHAPGSPTSRLAGMVPRGQMPGGGARAALPGRDSGGPGGPSGTGSQPGRTSGGLPTRSRADSAGPSAFGGWTGPGRDGGPGGRDDAAGLPPAGAGAPAGGPGHASDQGNTAGTANAFDSGSRSGAFPAGAGASFASGGHSGAVGGFGDRSDSGDQDGPASRGRDDVPGRLALPPRGPAAELPEASSPGQPPGTGWGARRAARGATDDWPTTASRDGSDTPRGHEDVESTGQFARPDVRTSTETTGQFARPDTRTPTETTGQFAGPDLATPPARLAGASRSSGRGPGDTGEFPRPGTSAPPQQDTGQYALPPSELDTPATSTSGPGDDRTPLFDTLESDWFRGHSGRDRSAAEPSAPPEPSTPPTPRPQAAYGSQNGSEPAWRSSPNDELGRQAERIRQPAAGGVTTSGLPRRVPRANLVAGTAAKDQTHPIGPQVSRAPDDVRGRLTNLRRGIRQGREAGSESHGSNNQGFGRTYQQER